MDPKGASVVDFRTKDHAPPGSKHIVLGPLIQSSPDQSVVDAWRALYTRKMFYKTFFFRRTKTTVARLRETLQPKNEVIIWIKL